MSQLTVSDIYRELTTTLTPQLGKREATSAARIILEDVRGLTPTDIVAHGYRSLEQATVDLIRKIAGMICDGCPVQYAVGQARFYGMNFIVDHRVLIPRPETEGLVDIIVDDYVGRSDLDVLDCGTGSGCIAIALARTLPFASVCAIDISGDAIDIAQKNAERLNTDVNFRKADILSLPETSISAHYDIIVSNPPYITESEATEIDPRVKDREPSIALFVPDNDPLKFYIPISLFAVKALKRGGTLYFEINPRFADMLSQHLRDIGFKNIDILRDYVGHYRYIKAAL